ncbi:hypothetical protein ACF1BN_32150 [Streptomyces sp. NPDC014861]|uniref:hypothetical protein n=1 Tax=Streptomyces sp. NPDC014861 TaxID=3364923 RepID=UPI0036F66A3D
MAPMSEHLTTLRAERQLRRVRTVYAAGAVLWASTAAWSAWARPGSRQMWVCLLLLGVFAGLLTTTSFWLSRLRAEPVREPTRHAAPGRGPTRHAAPQRAIGPRQASA